MRIIKSLKGRMDGVLNDIKSHYWDYIYYYKDNVVWDKTILFESFGGKSFQGNPYYLYKTALQMEEFSGFSFYVSHREPKNLRSFLEQRGLFNSRVKIVEYGSAEYREVLSHAKYLINNVSFTMDWIKKEGQVYLNTWHGTTLKCLGRCIKNDAFELNNSQRNMLLADILLASNNFTMQVFDDDYMIRGIDPAKIVLNGYPRNTVFFDKEYRQEVRKRHGLNRKTAIFYMPTWRGTSSGVKQIDYVSDMEQLAEKLGDQYVIYIKLHPAMSIGPQGLRKCMKMPEEYEVYEFLNAMDILITDYSSVYFDFANAGQRLFLYQHDREQYFKNRGYYSAILEETPYPIATTLKQLESYIRDEIKVDDTAFRKKYCLYDHIDAGRDLLRTMLEKTNRTELKEIDLYVINFPITDEKLRSWRYRLTEIGRNFRFVFVPRRSNGRYHNISCFTELEYFVCYDSYRLTMIEYLLPAKVASREQKRLWGLIKCNVYSKGGRLPLALRDNVKEWPKYLL